MSAFLERFAADRRRPVNDDPMLMGVGDVELPSREDAPAAPAPSPAPVATDAPPASTPFLDEFNNSKMAEEAVAGVEDMAKPVEEDPSDLARLIELIPDYGNMPEGPERTAYVERAQAQVAREREERAARRNTQQALARNVFGVASGPMPQGEVDDARAAAQQFAEQQRAALPAHAAALEKKKAAKAEGLARFLESKRIGGAMQGPMRPEDAEGVIDEYTGRAAIRNVKPFPSSTPYDTKLTPAEEVEFQKWKAQYAPWDSGEDYDLRGAFKSGFKPDENGHWPDTFKKPNHPTFSNESVYAKVRPELAGRWEGEKFIPSPYQADQERIREFEFDQIAKESQKILAQRDEARRSLGQFLNPYTPDEALADIDRKVEMRAQALLGAARVNASMLTKPLTPQEEEEAKVNAYRRAFQEVASKALNERERSIVEQQETQAKLDDEWSKMWGGSSLAPPGPRLPVDPLADANQGVGAAGAQITADVLRRAMWALSIPFINAEDMANWVSKQRTGEGLIDEGLRNVGPAVAGINKILASPFAAAEWVRSKVEEKSPYLFDPKQSKATDWFSPDTRKALAEGGAAAAGLLAAKGVHGAISEAATPLRPIGDTGFMGKQVRPGNSGYQVLKVMKDRDMPQSPGDAAREAAQRQAMREMGPSGAPEARKAEAAAAGRYARALEAAGAKATPVDAPLAELEGKLGAAEGGRSAEGITPADIGDFEKYLSDDHAAEIKRALDEGMKGTSELEEAQAVYDRKIREADQMWRSAQNEKKGADLQAAKAEHDRAIREATAEHDAAQKGSKGAAALSEAVAQADRELRGAREALAKLDEDRSLSSTQDAAKIRRQIADLQRRRDAALSRLPGEVRDAAKALDEARAARESIERDSIAQREALADDIQRREAGPTFRQRARQGVEDAMASPDAEFERAIDSGTRERAQFQGMADEAYAQEGYAEERSRAHDEAVTRALRAAQEKKERRQARLRRIAPALETPAGRDAEVERAKAIVNRRFDAELQQRAQERAALRERLGREFNAVELGQERLWMRSFRDRRLRAIERAEDNARAAIHRMINEHREFERRGNALTKAEADAIRAKYEREAAARVERERDMSSGEHRARARGHTAENAGELDAARAAASRVADEAAAAAARSQAPGTPRKASVFVPEERTNERGAVVKSKGDLPIRGGPQVELSPEEAAAEVDRLSKGEPLIVPPGWRPPQDTVAVPDSGIEQMMRQNAEERNAADARRQTLAARRVGAPLAEAPDISGEQSRVAIPTEGEVEAFGKPGRPGIAKMPPTVSRRPAVFTPFKKPPEGGTGPITILGPDGKPMPPAPEKPAPKGPAPFAAGAARANKYPGVDRTIVAGFRSIGARLRKTGRVSEGGVEANIAPANDKGVYEYTVKVDGKVAKSGGAASFDKASGVAADMVLEELAAKAKTPERVEAAAAAAGPLPPADAPAASLGFTTSKGSKYVVDGKKTTRTKFDGSKHKSSDLTVYIDNQQASLDLLSDYNEKKFEKRDPAILQGNSGKIALRYWESPAEAGEVRRPNDAKQIDFKYHDEPAVGRVPLELWHGTKESGPVFHVGHEITTIDRAPKTDVKAEPAKVETPPTTEVKAAPEAPKAPPVTRSAEDFIADLEQRTGIRAEVPPEVAENLKERFGNKRPADVAKAEARRKLDVKSPDYWIDRLEDAIDPAKAEGVPPAIREEVLNGIKNPGRRAGVRAAMSDPSFRADDTSLVGATTRKLMEGHEVADIGVKAARDGFDAAAKTFVEESERLKRMPRSADLMEAVAQRLVAGEDPLDVLRDALRVETEGAKARAPKVVSDAPKVNPPKVPPVADVSPVPAAERKVPAPMRKKVVTSEAPAADEAKAASDAFAPDDLQTPFDGDTGPIFDSKGNKYRFSMESVDPRMIRGSFADERGTRTEGFPEGFQARNFNAGKVKEIVDGFDAERLGSSDTSPVVGGPVLWRDPRTGIHYTIAGNHRYLGGQIANYYSNGVPRAFRVLREPYGRAKTFAAFSQDSPAAKMTLAERARAAAVGYKLGVDHMPGALPSEPLDATNIRKFLERTENRRFTERVFPEGVPADKFADDTVFQAEAALLGLMPEGVRNVIETAADKTVEAIMAAAPALLAMRSKAVRGIARREFDLLGYFERAAQAFKHVESKKMTPAQLAQHIRDLAETNDLQFEGASARDVSPLSHLDPVDAGFLLALSKTETLQNPRSYFVEAIKKLDALSQEHTPGQTSIFGGGVEEIPVGKILEATFGPQLAKMVERYIDVRARNGEVTRLIKVEDPEKTVFGTGEDAAVASPAANEAVKAVDAMSQPKVGKPKGKGRGKGKKGEASGEAGFSLHGGPLGWIFAGIKAGVDKLMEAPEYERRMPAAARAEMEALEGSRRPLPSTAKALGRSVRAAYEGAREFGDIYSEVRHEPGIGNATKGGEAINLQVDLKDSAHGLMNADEVATEKAMEIRNAAKNRESLVLASRAIVYKDLLRMVEENEDLPRRKAYAQSEIQRIMAIRRGRLNGELTRSERDTLEAAKAVLREKEKSLSGHTPAGIRAILAEVNSEIAGRPDAQEVVRLTREALDGAARDLSAIDPSFRGKRDYFPHHIIFDYTLDAPPSTGSSGPVKRPFLKAKVHRGGTERPFDVDIAEVVYKHVRDIGRAKVLHDFYEKFRVSKNNLLPEVLRTGKLPDGLTPADVSLWSFNRTPTKVGVPVELAHDRAVATAALRGAIASGVNPGEVIRQFNRGRTQPYVLVKTNVARALDGATEFAHVPSDNIAMIATDMAHALFRWTTLTARGGMDFIERNFGGDMVNLLTHVPGTSAEVVRAPIEAGLLKPFSFMGRAILEKMTGKEDPVLHRAREFNAYQSGLWGSALEARHRGSLERMVTGKEGPREPWNVLSPAAKAARVAVSIPLAPFSIVANLRVALEASTRMQACEALVREGYNLNAARVLGNQVLVDYSLLSRNAKLTRRLLAPYLAFVLQTSNNFLFPKVRSRATVWARVGAMAALPMLYNWAVTPDMERELSPKYQATPHINIGRDKDGKVVSIDLPRFGMEPPTSAKILAGIAGKMASYAFDEDLGDNISRIASGALGRAGEDILGMSGPGVTAGTALLVGKDIRNLEDLENDKTNRMSTSELEYHNFVKYGVPIANIRLAKALSSFTGIFRPPAKGIMAAPGVEKVVDGTKVGEFYKRYERLNPKAAEQARGKFIGGGALVPTKTTEPYERGLELREEESVATMRAFADLIDAQREPGANKAKLELEKKKILAKMKELRLTPETVRQFIRGRGRDLWKSNLPEDQRKKLMNQRFAPSAPEPRKE